MKIPCSTCGYKCIGNCGAGNGRHLCMKLIPLCCGNPKCIGNCGGNGPRRPA